MILFKSGQTFVVEITESVFDSFQDNIKSNGGISKVGTDEMTNFCIKWDAVEAIFREGSYSYA